MKCPKCNGDMVCKQQPGAAVGAGQPKSADVGRAWYCKKCGKFLDELEDKSSEKS